MEKTTVVSVEWLVTALASVLLAAVLFSSPAFAQARGEDDSVQYIDCSQVQTIVMDQGGQYGVAVGREARTEIARELNISQKQVNACLGNIGVNDDVDDNNDDTTVDDGEDTTTVEAAAKGDVLSHTIPEKKVLASTGGMPLSGSALLAFAMIGAGLSLLGFGIRRNR